jgi:hypothetical protein
VARTEIHVLLALQRNYPRAISIARSAREIEEIAETLAVLGEFDAARKCLPTLAVADEAMPMMSAEIRHRNTLIVFATELFRREQIERACAVVNETEQAGADLSDRIFLTAGLACRVPSPGYPYPDY